MAGFDQEKGSMERHQREKETKKKKSNFREERRREISLMQCLGGRKQEETIDPTPKGKCGL